MGFPLGPTLASAFLCFHEKKWIENCPLEFISFTYRRYVDDCFLVLKKRDLMINSLTTSTHDIVINPSLWNRKLRASCLFWILSSLKPPVASVQMYRGKEHIHTYRFIFDL